MQKIYISGSGCISPQKTFEDEFPFEPLEKETKRLLIEKPEYKKYISPIRLRRMKHILRMGIASANKALEESGSNEVDAIICGTAMGCLEDTEKFLTDIIKNDEDLLNPTAFIQSTHNTVAGQIALINKCNGYNYTYVNRGFSFENSLFDAQLMLSEGKVKKVLAGGLDEATSNYFDTFDRLDLWKKETEIKNLNLLDYDSPGTVLGEGAAFFVLESEQSESSQAVLQAMQMIYKPKDSNTIVKSAERLIKQSGMEVDDIDLILTGANGDNRQDYFYKETAQSLGHDSYAYFKHLSGEYHTASSFGTWLALQIIKSGNAPAFVMNDGKPKNGVKNILIYNHYMGKNHSLTLVSST